MTMGILERPEVLVQMEEAQPICSWEDLQEISGRQTEEPTIDGLRTRYQEDFGEIKKRQTDQLKMTEDYLAGEKKNEKEIAFTLNGFNGNNWRMTMVEETSWDVDLNGKKRLNKNLVMAPDRRVSANECGDIARAMAIKIGHSIAKGEASGMIEVLPSVEGRAEMLKWENRDRTTINTVTILPSKDSWGSVKDTMVKKIEREERVDDKGEKEIVRVTFFQRAMVAAKHFLRDLTNTKRI